MIVFVGPPGSGKGTQSRLLGSRDNFEIISVGEVLRNEVKSQTKIGIEIEKSLKKGEFAKTHTVCEVIKKKLDKLNTSKILLDGFPRNIDQAIALDEILGEEGCFEKRKNFLAIDFSVPLEALKERLRLRKVCKKCEASFFPESSFCSFCGSLEFYTREDDSPEIIEKRMKKFVEERSKIVDFYSQKNNFLSIDATLDVEEVYNRIKACIIF